MNFFKLYIGDYQRDTAHLSVTEHGAYLLMLQHYYATERPLPTGKALHRMLRAQDKAEREAIDVVAAQFWTETPAGLVNGRADAELSKAGAQAETNRAIAQAREARRKAAREKHGESTNRATNDQPNQTPDTRHQTPEERKHDHSTGVGAGQGPTRAGSACLAMRRAGLPDANPSDPRLLALLDAGITDEELAAAAADTAAKRRGFAYALAVAEGRRRDAAAITGLPAAQQRRATTTTDRRSAALDALTGTAPPAGEAHGRTDHHRHADAGRAAAADAIDVPSRVVDDGREPAGALAR